MIKSENSDLENSLSQASEIRRLFSYHSYKMIVFSFFNFKLVLFYDQSRFRTYFQKLPVISFPEFRALSNSIISLRPKKLWYILWFYRKNISFRFVFITSFLHSRKRPTIQVKNLNLIITYDLSSSQHPSFFSLLSVFFVLIRRQSGFASEKSTT